MSQRVDQCFATIARIVAKNKEIKLHAQDVGKPTAHIRVRIDLLLTRPELVNLREKLERDYPEWSNISVSNVTWQRKWFTTAKGVQILMYFEPQQGDKANEG